MISAADQFGVKPGWQILSISGFPVPQGNKEQDKLIVYDILEKALKNKRGMVVEFTVPLEDTPTSSNTLPEYSFQLASETRCELVRFVCAYLHVPGGCIPGISSTVS